MPVTTASFIARIRCTRSRAASPVIAAGLRPGQAGLAVGRYRELQGHMGASVAHAAEVAGMRAQRVRATRPTSTVYALLAQPRVPLAGDARVGIFQRGHNAFDPRPP